MGGLEALVTLRLAQVMEHGEKVAVNAKMGGVDLIAKFQKDGVLLTAMIMGSVGWVCVCASPDTKEALVKK
jgi:hypothetical protein